MSVRHSTLVAFVILVWFGSSSRAQGFVPGGWSSQVGYQVVGGGGTVGAFSSGGYGSGPLGWGGSPFGNGYGYAGGMTPFGPASNLYSQSGQRTRYPGTMIGAIAPTPSTINAVDPLIGSIRQATRRSRR